MLFCGDCGKEFDYFSLGDKQQKLIQSGKQYKVNCPICESYNVIYGEPKKDKKAKRAPRVYNLSKPGHLERLAEEIGPKNVITLFEHMDNNRKEEEERQARIDASGAKEEYFKELTEKLKKGQCQNFHHLFLFFQNH